MTNNRTPTDAHRLLTVAEVAQLLNVSQRQVRRWISEGALQVYRTGRCVRIAPAEIKRFLAASETSAATGIPCLDQS